MLLSSDGIMGPCIPTPDAAENKPYIFRYSILPHEKNWKDVSVYRHGAEINMPLFSIQVKRNDNNKMNSNNKKIDYVLPDTKSFLEIDKKNIILSTIKLSEDKKTIILRVYETEGKKTPVKITFPIKIKNAKKTDFMDNSIEDIKKIDGNSINIEIGPFKIVTMKISF